jgi:glutamate-ammonia-ligase adenylyltransferase
MNDFASRVAGSLAGSTFAGNPPPAVQRFLEMRGDDASAKRIDGPLLDGLARLVATQPDVAGFLAGRPHWLERVAALTPTSLAEREATLDDDAAEIEALDLEDALDALRLRRREETALAACADLAGLTPFPAISDFLSSVAETTTRFALSIAERRLPESTDRDAFAVIGMGKIAGREFTYHSDLDLIFLFRGGATEIDRASRLGQRLISTLTTMTGAGIAYEVDTRLRPSGQQGMLVASFEGYERYQKTEAATWEHLAMLRARPIAGAVDEAAERLTHVREHVLPAAEPPWEERADLRRRVVEERAASDDGVRAIKTGAGGLMDVDFLAGGGLLERGASTYPDPPSVSRMLRSTASDEAAAEALLADYHALRRIEARVRWVSGRGVEQLPGDLGAIAELVEPELEGEALRARVRAARGRIRDAFRRVIAAGSIDGL